MSDIELACHLGPWGHQNMINAISDIEAANFRGIEMTSQIVEQYEDRVGVFIEILSQHKLQLMSITAGGALWPGMNLEEEVERCLNIARFVKAAGAKHMALYPPRPNPDQPMEDALDIMPAATAYGEIARRTLEMEVFTCLHPECGTLVDNEKTIDQFIGMADPEALKLCVDVGFLAEADIPIGAFLNEHKKRLGLVHLKDIKTKELKVRKDEGKAKKVVGKKHKEAAKPHGVELGKGNIDLELFVDTLMKKEYSGWATIEFDTSTTRSLREIAQSCHKYAEQHLDLVL